MFATDRDLLVLEPNVFGEVGWVGQKLLAGVGSISGTTLTLSVGDFAAVGINTGHVVIVAGVPMEILARNTATTATISLVRPSSTGSAIPPVALSGVGVEVWTFGPQLEQAHRQVLRLLGIEPDSPVGLDGIDESMIVNPRGLFVLEALLTLAGLYAAAGATAPMASGLARKAEQYRLRAGHERTQAVARIDVDGDGLPEFARRPGVIPLVRG
jgi:hypothetical protein